MANQKNKEYSSFEEKYIIEWKEIGVYYRQREAHQLEFMNDKPLFKKHYNSINKLCREYSSHFNSKIPIARLIILEKIPFILSFGIMSNGEEIDFNRFEINNILKAKKSLKSLNLYMDYIHEQRKKEVDRNKTITFKYKNNKKLVISDKFVINEIEDAVFETGGRFAEYMIALTKYTSEYKDKPNGYYAKFIFDYLNHYNLFTKKTIQREFVCKILQKAGKIKNENEINSTYPQYFSTLVKGYKEQLFP